MKNKTFLFLFILCCYGCIKDHPLKPAEKLVGAATSFGYAISLPQVHSVLSPTKNNGTAYTITPILSSKGDTLMYIVNFEENHGWKILSADARTPAVIAESDSGSFSLDDGNEGVRIWIDCSAADLDAIRRMDNDELAFSEEQISANVSFWSGNFPDKLEPPAYESEGQWHIRTTVETILVDSMEHMTPPWHQYTPYNDYCPFRTDDPSKRAPAGCVAIAGANVLFYLHKIFGEPQKMVSNAYCYGNIDGYFRSFDTPTSSVWAAMDTTFKNSASEGSESILIGHIGDLSGMHYHNSYSWALPAYLRTNVFDPYGYSCLHGNYNENIVKSNLEEGLPVIVTATNLLIPVDFDIHCFVIDGYRKTQLKYTYYHYWEPNDPLNFIYTDEYASYYTYSYSSPEITSIKINWGWHTQWESSHLNDGWYSLTGGWAVSDKIDYNHNREMIYGFSVKE